MKIQDRLRWLLYVIYSFFRGLNVFGRLKLLAVHLIQLADRIAQLESKLINVEDDGTPERKLLGNHVSVQGTSKGPVFNDGHNASCECFACGKMPEWYRVAAGEMGTKEASGVASNPRIVEYHGSVDIKETADHIPWCASFICWCLHKANKLSPRSAWARHFIKYGVEVETPKRGDICVFSLGKVGGHVGLYHSENTHDIIILGGNQKDSVCLMNYPKTRLLAIRRPV